MDGYSFEEAIKTEAFAISLKAPQTKQVCFYDDRCSVKPHTPPVTSAKTIELIQPLLYTIYYGHLPEDREELAVK